jgi:hypothetical protein
VKSQLGSTRKGGLSPWVATDTWSPGLDNGERSLVEIYLTMPRNPGSAVPWYVRLLENPRSPLALAGAVDLLGHDCMHVVLGRGQLPQDEAFVLGFAMGADRCSKWQQWLFRVCARYLYRGVYRFSDIDVAVFNLAVEVGRRLHTPLHRIDFRGLLERPLREVRRILGIEREVLCAAYARERVRWPFTRASARLPR